MRTRTRRIEVHLLWYVLAVAAVAVTVLVLLALLWTTTATPAKSAPAGSTCYTVSDFNNVKRSMGCTSADPCYIPAADFNASGRVDVRDFAILKTGYQQCGLPWLKTMDGRIVRADTDEGVELRGVNLLRYEWVENMDFEREAIPHLANTWHANIITHGFASGPVVAGNAAYLAVLDEYQQLAEANHMYIIFAYYYAEINGDQPSNPDADPNSEDALVALVERYRDKSNVLFMLQAEPHSDEVRVTWNDYCDTDGVQLRPIYDRMVMAMRAADNPSPNKHLILASGDGYGRDILPVVEDEYGCNNGNPDPITADGGENIVYSSHPYDPPSEWGYFLPVADAGYPVFVTEFGTGGQQSQSDVEALVSTMNGSGRHIGWTSWIFDSEGCPCLLQGNRLVFTPSSPYGAFIRDTTIDEATRFP